MLSERLPPRFETAFAQEGMSVIVNQILDNNNTLLGQSDRERVLRFASTNGPVNDADAVDKLVARLDVAVNSARLLRRVLADLLALLPHDPVAYRGDLGCDAGERI